MNGKPVEKRTYEGCCQKWQIGWVGEWVKLSNFGTGRNRQAGLDLGPQLPTHVTNIVKSGTNLLQAVGNFDGKYIILVAFMSVGSNLRCPELPDYVVPAAAASDSGNKLEVGFQIGGWWARVSFDECDGHANKPKYKPPVPQESPTSIADPNIIILTEGDNDMDSNPNQDCHDTISHGQSQSQVSASTTIQSPTHAVGMTSTSMNAMSHGQSRSQFSASNTLQLLAHAIGTSSTIMNDMSHGQSQSKRQSQMSASNMQLPTQLVLSAVMDAVSEGPSQTYVSNHMQFQQHNLNSMRNDQSGRYPTPATHISIIPTASTGTVIGVRKQQFYNYHIDQHQTVRMMSRSAVSEHGLTG
ncbi:hypothetical protein Tco_1540852 [Tanacetum coccineum]